jgi:hypothetical protein
MWTGNSLRDLRRESLVFYPGVYVRESLTRMNNAVQRRIEAIIPKQTRIDPVKIETPMVRVPSASTKELIAFRSPRFHE